MDIETYTDFFRVNVMTVKKFPTNTSSDHTPKTIDPELPKQDADQIFAKLIWNDFQMNLRSKPVEPTTLSSDDSMELQYQTKFCRAVNGFRNPEWAQGCWTNLCTNGGDLLYTKSVLNDIDPHETELLQKN